ncbi:MAG: endopeptidase La [Limnochordales bacterium]|nr:endopeptidase La [Limnochordales bacterium]
MPELVDRTDSFRSLRAGAQRVLPLLPLRNMVIFPGQVVTLDVGRAKSILAIQKAAGRDGLLVVATQKDADQLEPERDAIYPIGTLVQILLSRGVIALLTGLAAADGESFRVTVRGLERVRLTRIWQKPTYRAAVKLVPEAKVRAEDPECAAALLALERGVREYAQTGRPALFEGDELPEELLAHPERVADLLAARLPLSVKEKQELLEEVNIYARLVRVYEHLNREIAVARLDQRVQERVRQQMERSQRDYYLREQLRAIQQELGESEGTLPGDSEIEAYRRKINEAGLPEEAARKANQELERLSRMPLMSPEAAVIRTYLDWLISIPWQKRSEDRLDLALAREILEADHYGLEEAKRRILEFLAVRRLAGTGVSKGPILCLVGPPGVGKTSLARSIARALGRSFVRFSLGGLRDEAEIRGHRRTYVGALPGRIVQALKQAGTINPVLLLDEIDKMGMDVRGDPASALLEVLDPEQNRAFSDHYLEVPVNLSEVLFITTANYLGGIPRPLLDRLEVIEISGYTEDEKFQIGRRYLWPKQMRENGLSEDTVSLADSALRDIIRKYTREAGVRQLERQLGKLCRRIALHLVEAGPSQKKLVIGRSHLKKYLGAPLFRFGEVEGEDRVGVATGLAYTEVGGDILSIEVVVAPGMGRFVLTGKLGEVMRESAQAAHTYIRSQREALQITADFPDRMDIHIHVPEGSIPKDGPSAGITMATALASALTGRPVRRDVAMTGEITLRGRVLPVGGLKEKLLAAARAGIKTVLIPADNEKDLSLIPASVRRKLDIRLVREMHEVLAAALLPAAPATGGPEASSPAQGEEEKTGEVQPADEGQAGQGTEQKPGTKEKAAKAG